MLCDSLLLLLVEQGIIRKDQAIDAIEGVIDAKIELAGVTEGVVVSIASIALLREVGRSLAAAVVPNKDGPPPASAT